MKDLLSERLNALQATGRLRDPDDALQRRAEAAAEAQGLPLLFAATNDYLGLARLRLPAHASPAGAGAARLIHGTDPAHREFESRLAEWLGCRASLLFASGYAANVGAIAALAQPGDHVISDRLNHASIVDGCRLSRAQISVVPHLDYNAMEGALRAPRTGHAWLVCEGYFSMDGDSPDLPRLADLAQRHGASLYIDEAHSLGVFGPEGRGLCAAAGVTPDVLVGTLGKAFGLHGAFVAGSRELRHWLWNAARSFVYSTATSPAQARDGIARLDAIRSAEVRRTRLQRHIERVELAARRYRTPAGRHGPVFPLILGDESTARSFAEHCAALGILVQSIRPPTVPAESCRIRLSLSAAMTDQEVDRILAALETF